MMKPMIWLLTVSLLGLGLTVPMTTAQVEVARMSTEELNARLSDPKMVVVDVRTRSDWHQSQSKIKGAVRVEPRDAGLLIEKYDKKHSLVFYCA